MGHDEQIARAGRIAGRFVGKMMPKAKAASSAAAKQWAPTSQQSKQFIKHVLPATIKPIHALWHEFIAFIFLAVAGIIAFHLWQKGSKLGPFQMILIALFGVIMAGYGIASVIKSRKISRS